MKSLLPIRVLYLLSAAYDGLLGLAFLVAGPQIFALAEIMPPNHWGYVHFAAGILVIFGYMFLRVALCPLENHNLIIYGILLKVCYVGTVGWHWLHGGLPDLWKYFAVADAVFAGLFVWSWLVLKPVAMPEAPAFNR